VIIKHCLTFENLASLNEILLNDFGKEFEVCCKTILDVHKVEKTENYWSIVCEKFEDKNNEKEILEKK
jgi:hypothetical protein